MDFMDGLRFSGESPRRALAELRDSPTLKNMYA